MTTQQYKQYNFVLQLFLVASDYYVQTNGVVAIASSLDAGYSTLNKEAMKFDATTAQTYMPLKVKRIFIANENFVMSNIVIPFFLLFTSKKMKSKMKITGHDHKLIVEELGPHRALVEVGGELNIDGDDPGSASRSFMEAQGELHLEHLKQLANTSEAEAA
jgi:hypothetical protein